MSIRDRLRSSSSIVQSLNTSKDNALNNGDIRVVTGIALSCDDMSEDGEIHRDFRLIRGVHRTVDFVRASASNPSGYISVAAGGAAKATFSSPVMSRRHARITFADDGSVTVMDVGSMHGTYVNIVDSDGLLPEMLKTRRHYELRSGDTLLLGKSINRDGRDWTPVAIRVTFTYDSGARLATPPTNRYGLFLNSVGASGLEVVDEDAYSVSSSSDGEEDDHVGPSGSSPDNSPVISHVPLPLGVVGSAATSRESLVSGSRSSDDLNSASGVFDMNRSISARNALRAILPPIPRIQSAIRRLPSLRELGIFSSLNVSAVESNKRNDGLNQDGEAPMSASGAGMEEPNTTTLPPISVDLPDSNQDVPPNAQSPQSTDVEDDMASPSMFAWQEPSHPQNQLGLELDEQSAFCSSPIDLQVNVDESQGFSGLQNSQYLQGVADHQEEKPDKVKGADEEKEDDVRSMDISPSTSREGTPTPDRFRASIAFDVERPVADDVPSRPAETEEHCRCHEREEQQQDHSQETQPSIPPPVTPQKRRASYTLTPGSAAELDTDRRRARVARFEVVGFDAIPSPVSIGKERKKRVCARVGPTRRSPAPNPPGPFGRSKVATKHSPDVDVLRARVRSLESRMHEIQGSAMMMASVANASTSASAASVEEARKDMENMREEMRRLSGLMETLVAKMEVRARSNVPIATECPADTPLSESGSPASRKRKRSDDDTCTLGAQDMAAMRLSLGLADQVGQAGSALKMEERIRSFHESAEEPSVRPAKRSRTAERNGGEAVVTVATAVGYTTLGAALAWATLAYVL